MQAVLPCHPCHGILRDTLKIRWDSEIWTQQGKEQPRPVEFVQSTLPFWHDCLLASKSTALMWHSHLLLLFNQKPHRRPVQTLKSQSCNYHQVSFIVRTSSFTTFFRISGPSGPSPNSRPSNTTKLPKSLKLRRPMVQSFFPKASQGWWKIWWLFFTFFQSP